MKWLTTVEKNSTPSVGSKSLGYAFKPATKLFTHLQYLTLMVTNCSGGRSFSKLTGNDRMDKGAPIR